MTKMIPVEVAEKGLTAKYVQLSHEIDLARMDVKKREREHAECMHRIYNLISYDYGNGIPSPVFVGYDGEVATDNENSDPWTHALLVEEVAKRLPEIVGKLKEAQFKRDNLYAEMKELTGKYDE